MSLISRGNINNPQIIHTTQQKEKVLNQKMVKSANRHYSKEDVCANRHIFKMFNVT